MRASGWSATTLASSCRRSGKQTRRADANPGPSARRERAAQLRSVRDHGGHGLPGARSRGRPGRDRGCRVRGHRPRAARATWARARRCSSGSRPPARPRRRLRARALQRARALGRRPRGLRHTLALFDAAQATHARPVLCDAGGPERIANPGRGGEDPALRLDDSRWATLVDGVARAAEIAREAGYEPVFHHHTSSYVEGLPEIERFLDDTEVDLLLDSGHLAVAGGDPIQGLKTGASASASCTSRTRAWTCCARSASERADMISAWRRGLFCALGDGDVDLVGFCAELERIRRLGGDRAGPRARGQRRFAHAARSSAATASG